MTSPPSEGDPGAPPPAPPAPPPRPAPPPPRTPGYVPMPVIERRSPVGWILIALITGVALGASCMTCARAMPGAGGGTQEFAGESRRRVGVIEVSGAIMETSETVRMMRELARRDDLDAVVVRIDSPGGAVAPSQELYQGLRAIAVEKPVVASMGSVAASGGYWTALGADWIFASPGSITGSIGVISQAPDLRKLADLARVEMRTFKSGPHKDAGSPLREMTPEDEEIFMDLIRDVYDQFVTLVSERRKLDMAAVRRVADGRFMTGRVAKDAGLVDELGGLYDAARKAAVLAEEKDAKEEGRDVDPKVGEKDPTLVYIKKPGPGLLRILTEDMSESVLEGLSRGLSRALGEATSGGFGGFGETRPPVELR